VPYTHESGRTAPRAPTTSISFGDPAAAIEYGTWRTMSHLGEARTDPVLGTVQKRSVGDKRPAGGLVCLRKWSPRVVSPSTDSHRRENSAPPRCKDIPLAGGQIRGP